MTLAPLLAAGPAVQIHVATVVTAIAMTAVILPLKKGTRLHRGAGRVWAASMMATALSSFWINSFELAWGVGPIHIFSLITLISVPWAIYAIRRGWVETHKQAMMGVVFGGIGIAGVLAFTPGRMMWTVVFG